MKRISAYSLLCAAIIIAPLYSSAAPEAQSTASGKKPVIAGVIFQEDQFFRLLSYGMEDAAKKGGAEFLLGNSNNKPDKEVQLLDSYMARKVDAIIISPLNSRSSAAALNRAAAKGAKIIMTNSTIEGEAPASFIESNQMELGTKTGEEARKYIEQKLGGKAKIAILAYKSFLSEQSDARTNGFKQEMAKVPGAQIVAEQDAWLSEAAVKKAGDILTANPDINLVWSANEGGTVGSVLAVKNAGKAGKVVVFGTDVSQQLLDFLQKEDDILQAITAQQPYEIGTKACETALKVVQGELVEKKITMGGVTLKRSDPEGIKNYKARLNELISRTAK